MLPRGLILVTQAAYLSACTCAIVALAKNSNRLHLVYGTMTFTRHGIPGHEISDAKLDPSIQALTLSDVRMPGAPLVYVNRGFEKLTGYERGEVIGQNCRFLQGPDTSSDAVAQMRTAIASGDPLILDVLNYRKNGTPFWNRLSLTPVKDRLGRTTHYIGIQSDITRMRFLQERLQLIALDLAATEKHELE